jgi:hypothetical protein
MDGVDEMEVLEDLWKVVEEVNARMSKVIRLNRDMIYITTKEKPMPRVVSKNTVKRRETIELYSEDIEGMYRERSAKLVAGLPGIVLNGVSPNTKVFPHGDHVLIGIWRRYSLLMIQGQSILLASAFNESKNIQSAHS